MDTPSPATGITIALTGRDEVTAWRQLVEPLGRGVLPGPLVADRTKRPYRPEGRLADRDALLGRIWAS